MHGLLHQLGSKSYLSRFTRANNAPHCDGRSIAKPRPAPLTSSSSHVHLLSLTKEYELFMCPVYCAILLVLRLRVICWFLVCLVIQWGFSLLNRLEFTNCVWHLPTLVLRFENIIHRISCYYRRHRLNQHHQPRM